MMTRLRRQAWRAGNRTPPLLITKETDLPIFPQPLFSRSHLSWWS